MTRRSDDAAISCIGHYYKKLLANIFLGNFIGYFILVIFQFYLLPHVLPFISAKGFA